MILCLGKDSTTKGGASVAPIFASQMPCVQTHGENFEQEDSLEGY